MDNPQPKLSLGQQIQAAASTNTAHREMKSPNLQRTESAPDVSQAMPLDQFFNCICVDETNILQQKPNTKETARTIQRKTRLTPEEDKLFCQRVAATGQTQSTFIRCAILHGEVRSLTLPQALDACCDELLSLGGEIRKSAGLYTKALIAAKDTGVITAEEICEINKTIRQMLLLGDDLGKKGERIYGYLQTYCES